MLLSVIVWPGFSKRIIRYYSAGVVQVRVDGKFSSHTNVNIREFFLNGDEWLVFLNIYSAHEVADLCSQPARRTLILALICISLSSDI